MVLFFGLVALVAATLLSLRLRRLREFIGSPVAFELSDGRKVELMVRLVKHKGRFRQQIGIACSAGLDLHAEREDVIARGFKAIGVSRDLSCGDPALDQRLMLESDHPRCRDWLRREPDVRVALATLFDLGADAVTAYGGRVWASFSGPVKTLDESPQRQRAVADALQMLAASWPDALSTAHDAVRQHQRRAVLLLGISTGLAVAAVTMALTLAATDYPRQIGAVALYTGVGVALLILGLLLWRLAAGWIGDSARARVVLLELGTVGLASFVVSGALTAGQANILLSGAPVVQEEVRVDNVYARTSKRRHGRSSTHYYLSLPALRDGRAPADTFRIDADLYTRLQSGDIVRVSTRRGAFGVYFLTEAPIFVRRGPAP